MTVKYDVNHINGKESCHLNYINSQFCNVYKHVCHDLIDGNVNRQRHLHPFCIAFADVAGTRSGARTSIGYLTNEPHHHSIALIHPRIIDRFQLINNDVYWECLATRTNGVSSVNVKPILTYSDLRKVTDYSMKFAAQHLNDDRYCEKLELYLPKPKAKRSYLSASINRRNNGRFLS